MTVALGRRTSVSLADEAKVGVDDDGGTTVRRYDSMCANMRRADRKRKKRNDGSLTVERRRIGNAVMCANTPGQFCVAKPAKMTTALTSKLNKDNVDKKTARQRSDYK